MMKSVKLPDLIINVLAGAIVTLATLLLKRLFPEFDTDFLSLGASILAIVLLLGVHFLRAREFTSEPLVIPLVVMMITILAIWKLVGPETAPDRIEIPKQVSVVPITEPAQKQVSEPVPIVCSSTELCIFPVKGSATDIVPGFQTVVVFVDPGGGYWWPQNLDFPVIILGNGEWEGAAKIGDRPQPSGTEFGIIALLMNQGEVPTEMKAYRIPPSLPSFRRVRCKVQ